MPAIQTRTFSFSTTDLVQAALDFTQTRRRRHRLILVLAVGAGLMLVAFPILIVQVFMAEYADWVWGDFLVTLEEHAQTLGLLAAVILLALIGQPFLWRYATWKGIRENPDQYRDLQVTFSDDGVDFTWPTPPRTTSGPSIRLSSRARSSSCRCMGRCTWLCPSAPFRTWPPWR